MSTVSKITDYEPKSNEPTGYCPVGTCAAVVPERVLVCRDDVAKVPDDLLNAYYRTYRRGQTTLTATQANKDALAAVLEFCRAAA